MLQSLLDGLIKAVGNAAELSRKFSIEAVLVRPAYSLSILLRFCIEIEAETIQFLEEENAYNTLKAKSAFYALRDQLRFTIKPELRQEYESEIEGLVAQSKYPALVPMNWQDVSDLTVTNLYWYLNNSRDVQEQEVPA
ncbi:hypothetical protein [Myxacorys almedinensis]|uniref:Uncharacterized protein n=1 Tax=Myxacorys almedinensis A TaxID=2690445 RepID=A0A8J8CNA2_9CYAN|nr:hypothetical protein [Myxacorys almedinensis]NDJ19385.1 hypothetical protein [Myxacorys almedinensis A]